MSRVLRVVVLVLLAIAATGAVELVVPDACSLECSESGGCGACLPTCHRCGCCVQAVTLAADTTAGFTPAESELQPSRTVDLTETRLRKILHVPKHFL